MDDRRAALLLALLALAGAGVRLALAPARAAAPGDVRLVSVDTPPPGGLSATARQPAPLARPLLPGERVDLDRADVTELTPLPPIAPAFAQRTVAWREPPGLFGGLTRFDSVPGAGPKLPAVVRPVKHGGRRPENRGQERYRPGDRVIRAGSSTGTHTRGGPVQDRGRRQDHRAATLRRRQQANRPACGGRGPDPRRRGRGPER